jgi:hypothetical protein
VAKYDLTIMIIAQRLPDELVSFQKYVVKPRIQHEYLSGQIRNAEQSPVFSDIQNPQQLTLPVNKHLQFRNTGAKKQ